MHSVFEIRFLLGTNNQFVGQIPSSFFKIIETSSQAIVRMFCPRRCSRIKEIKPLFMSFSLTQSFSWGYFSVTENYPLRTEKTIVNSNRQFNLLCALIISINFSINRSCITFIYHKVQ